MKKIGLIGHPVVDEIHPVKGKIISGYGGVYYNATILSHLLKDEGIIYLISKVGYDIHDDFKIRMRTLGNINTENLIKVNRINNKVKLKFYTKFERKEYSTYVLPSLDEEEIENITDYDLILINFVSGRELKWETLHSIRKKYEGIIFIDIHSLLMGFGKKGERQIKKRGNWLKWIKLSNIIQMNHFEAEVVAKQKFKSDNEIVNFAKSLLTGYTEISIITLGERGSIIAFKEKNKLYWEKVRAFNYNDCSHSTGCGDAFSAGFVINYLTTYDPLKASTFGSKVGGFKAALNSSNQLEKFKYQMF